MTQWVTTHLSTWSPRGEQAAALVALVVTSSRCFCWLLVVVRWRWRWLLVLLKLLLRCCCCLLPLPSQPSAVLLDPPLFPRCLLIPCQVNVEELFREFFGRGGMGGMVGGAGTVSERQWVG